MKDSVKNVSSTWTNNLCTDLTVCQFLLHQRGLDGFVWDVLLGEPLVARRHQWQCVSVAVAVWRVAPRLGAVAAGVTVVAAVRVSSRPSGRVLIQEVGVGGGPGGPAGCWDLDGARTLHRLEIDAERSLERRPDVSDV